MTVSVSVGDVNVSYGWADGNNHRAGEIQFPEFIKQLG